MRRCSPGASSASGYAHYELDRRLVDSSSVALVGSAASRCRPERVGVTANHQKSVLSPLQRTTFLGMIWDSTSIQTRLSAVKRIRLGQSLTVIPFGLLYMRPLQWWLRTKGFSPRGNPFRMIKFMRQCFRTLVMWKKPWFLSQGPVLGASCRHRMLTTDASLTGWGAILEGRSSQGLWKDQHLSWHINRLEMLAVFLALKNFLADLRGHHVLIHPDNTLVVSYLYHQGGLRSCPFFKLACQILLWSQGKLLSLQAAYILGAHNIGADILLRQGLRPEGWRLHPEVVELIWRHEWICLHLERHLTVHSGTRSHIQLLSDLTRWCRCGRGFVCTHFSRSLCFR